MKMSVIEAAEHFGISKEAIHNRIRRGSLEVIIEDGQKFVLIDEANTTPKQTPATLRKTTASKTNKTEITDERYYKFLEEQNAKLQSRVETLEGETRTLRDQKELMLIEERQKIEAIYKEKDEQLKNILATLSNQFMLQTSQTVETIETTETIETLEVEIEDEVVEEATDAKIISLKKYLKTLNLSSKKVKKVTARFEKRVNKEERIIMIGDKIYLDTKEHDYSDLLRL